MRRVLSLSIGFVLSACGSIPEGIFACGADGDCPPGWFCHADGRCRSQAMELDGSLPRDAGRADGGARDADVGDTGPVCGQEICNGADDDCDGSIDEAFAGMPEVACNGLDDDCNGFIDEPPSLDGSDDCGCEWRSLGSIHYRLCVRAPAPAFDEVECGIGMRAVVISEQAEKDVIALLGNAVLAGLDGVFLGLRQDAGASTAAAEWRWIGGQGYAVVNDAAFDDRSAAGDEPVTIENGDQDCGCIRSDGTIFDCACAGDSNVRGFVCEEAAPEPCTTGQSCLLDHGCRGTLDCTRPIGMQCQGANTTEEVCNDWDDDCDGRVDVDTGGVHACGCSASVDLLGRRYLYCTGPMAYAQAACGPGFRLAVIDTDAENTFVASRIGPNPAWLGLHQPTTASTPAEGWRWHSRAPLGFESWVSGQPDDASDGEDGGQNCMRMLTGVLWDDWSCADTHPYVCEEL